MTIQVAVLCDAATNDNEKMSLLGTFDTIRAPQFPAAHPFCAVALRISFEKSEEGRHQMGISMVDEDGKSIFPQALPAIPVDVIVPGDSTFISKNYIFNFQGIVFQRPGLYSVDIAMDGRHQASIPLAVKLVPGAPKGPPPQEL